MIVLPWHGLVIVTPPKTASSSLHDCLCSADYGGIFVLGPQGDAPGPYEHHTGWVPWNYTEFRIVVVVRNPYTRFLSLYDHARAYSPPDAKWPGSLDEFAASLSAPNMHWFYRWSLSQFADDIRSGRDSQPLAIAGWIKTEFLEEGLRFHGVEVKVPRLHVSKYADRAPLNNAIRGVIENHWARDFQRFRYEMQRG
jgi:hypothetical protein